MLSFVEAIFPGQPADNH